MIERVGMVVLLFALFLFALAMGLALKGALAAI